MSAGTGASIAADGYWRPWVASDTVGSMARRVRESLEPADERRVPAPEVAAPPHVQAVLRMQATAGNRATSRLIARDAAEKTGTSSYAMTIADFGIYELSSFHVESKTRVTVSFDPGKDGSRLMHAAAAGQPIKSVTISAGGRTVTLTEVVIASFNHAADPARGDTIVSVEFDAKDVDIK
jgi:hypothetical protein